MADVIAIIIDRCCTHFCDGTCCVTTLFCVIDVKHLRVFNPYCLADVIANVADESHFYIFDAGMSVSACSFLGSWPTPPGRLLHQRRECWFI